MPGPWSTPADIRSQLQRYWDDGRLLAARFQPIPDADPLFPLRLRLVRPGRSALTERFDDVRAWIRTLEEGSRGVLGHGYQIDWVEINHRQLGRNRIPGGVSIPTEEDALLLLGKQRQAQRFAALLSTSRERCPALVGWMARRPMQVLENADDWDRLLAVLTHFLHWPRPGVYLRQLDIEGVDTKFIEARKSLLTELLDSVLPAEAVQSSALGPRQFEQRYGLMSKPPLVRFRLLDRRLYIRGMSDIATPAAQFAQLDLPVRRVFITENEINGLVFPDLPDSLVIFGLGYGLHRLAQTEWLRRSRLHYWGDIDTHGFVMLDRLRAELPDAGSFLMDRPTLMAHSPLWVREADPHPGLLHRLTEPEQSLYQDLRDGRLGDRVRLEQERISFGWLERSLQRLDEPTENGSPSRDHGGQIA
jgi:hypothetical protein